ASRPRTSSGPRPLTPACMLLGWSGRVADGLGYLQLKREMAAGNASNIAALSKRAADGDPCVSYTPITSVFPTTTVAALGSVNSGVAPTGHGLMGYTVFLPEFDMVAEMIRWGPLTRRVSFADPE